jgi:sensor histidine kinase YesM
MIINLITLTICTAVLYSVAKDILIQQYKELQLKQSQQLSNNISNLLKDVDNISIFIGTSPELNHVFNLDFDFSLTDIESLNKIFKYLNQYTQRYSFIASIYCYTNTGTIIGIDRGSNIYLNAVGVENNDETMVYYISDSIQASMLSPKQAMLFHEYTNNNFNYYGITQLVEDRYISHVKSYSALNNFANTISIVINIYESYYRSIYMMTGSKSKEDILIYVLDSTGEIASHSDETLINTKALSFNENNMKHESGYYTYKENSFNKQVVFTQIPGSSYILIQETPVNDITSGVASMSRTFFILLFISTILSFLMSIMIIKRITDPMKKLTYSMKKIEQGEFEHIQMKKPYNEIEVINYQFNKMTKSIQELIHKNIKVEEEKREMEIEALQAAINPHFIFNALNTIKRMAIVVNAKKVAEGLSALGNLLQPLYKYKGLLWTIHEEYNFIQNFMKIMNYRYGGGVIVTISFPEELMDYMMLTFILEPILENSFIHGLKVQSTSGKISVKAWMEEESIVFEVKDNGVGIDKMKLAEIKQSLSLERQIHSAEGIGISNVNRRIQLHYGSRYGIDIVSNSGTTVFIHLPKIHKDTIQNKNLE